MSGALSENPATSAARQFMLPPPGSALGQRPSSATATTYTVGGVCVTPARKISAAGRCGDASEKRTHHTRGGARRAGGGRTRGADG